MQSLIPTINQIIHFGLASDLEEANKEKLLEQNLVRLYSLSFDITYEYDEAEYPDFDRSDYRIFEAMSRNFPDFDSIRDDAISMKQKSARR